MGGAPKRERDRKEGKRKEGTKMTGDGRGGVLREAEGRTWRREGGKRRRMRKGKGMEEKEVTNPLSKSWIRRCNQWVERDKLAFLKGDLTGNAAQVL